MLTFVFIWSLWYNVFHFYLKILVHYVLELFHIYPVWIWYSTGTCNIVFISLCCLILNKQIIYLYLFYHVEEVQNHKNSHTCNSHHGWMITICIYNENLMQIVFYKSDIWWKYNTGIINQSGKDNKLYELMANNLFEVWIRKNQDGTCLDCMIHNASQ